MNTLGPIVLGTIGHEREGEEDGGEDGGGLKSQLLNTGNMMVELLDGLQNLDHNIQVKGTYLGSLFSPRKFSLSFAQMIDTFVFVFYRNFAEEINRKFRNPIHNTEVLI